jgi:hypothetical protein
MDSRKNKADTAKVESPGIQLRFLVDDMFMGMVLAKQPKGGSSSSSVMVINTRDIDAGILTSPDQLDRVELPATSQTEHYRVREGDVLVSARGAFKVARIQAESVGAIAGPNLIVIRPSPSLQPSLLYAFLRHPDIQAQIQRQSVKTTVASIGIDTIGNLIIRVPNESKQFDLAHLIDLAERQYVLGRRMAEIRRTLAQEIVARELIP